MVDANLDLAVLRKAKELSQAELAEYIGVSQATISRIENGETQLSLQLAAKLARVLEVDLVDIIPEESLRNLTGHVGQEAFYAFCPNPLCVRNKVEKVDNQVLVTWNSGQRYPSHRYEEVNFCTSCGTALVRECPQCKRLLENPGTWYCMSCGSRITDRPTPDEWAQIRELLAPKDDDDIPF